MQDIWGSYNQAYHVGTLTLRIVLDDVRILPKRIWVAFEYVKIIKVMRSLFSSLMQKWENKYDLKAFVNWRLVDKYFSWYARTKLKNLDFSIISNNCIAGGIYHKFGLQYATPTVGMFFFAQDYIKFLENFDTYIKLPLKFKDTSNYPEGNQIRKNKSYPIGVLNDAIELHFLHYVTQKEAVEKWNRRVNRINFSNLFFIFTDNEPFKEEFLYRFEKLPFKNKVFFSAKNNEKITCIVPIPKYGRRSQVGDSTRNREYESCVDLIKWLNGDGNFLKNSRSRW